MDTLHLVEDSIPKLAHYKTSIKFTSIKTRKKQNELKQLSKLPHIFTTACFAGEKNPEVLLWTEKKFKICFQNWIFKNLLKEEKHQRWN